MFVKVCQKKCLPKFARICQSLPEFAKVCQKIVFLADGGTGLIYKACCSLKPLVITKKYSYFEITCCKLKTQNSADLIIIIMYRTGSITKIFFDELDDVLSFMS